MSSEKSTPADKAQTGKESYGCIAFNESGTEGYAPKNDDLNERERSNRFRANMDFIEEPRQIVVLTAMIAVVGYLGYHQNEADRDTSTRAALAGSSFLFLVHCFLQCRDTLFVRPHPGVWRLVHGVGMLYLFGIAVLLFHTRAEARRLLAIVFTDMDHYSLSSTAPGDAPAMDCTLTWDAVKGQLGEVWFTAHVAGWWAKMCLFRDWHVCWVLSIGFEIVELSMGWLVPQFKECWWDSLFIDMLGANLLGMALGLSTLRFLENKGYDWRGSSSTLSSSSRGIFARAAHQFSPFSWRRWEWGTFTSFKRFCQIAVLVIVVLATELNAFMMLNALDVPKTSSYNATRLAVLFIIGLPGANEYYEYITNPYCSRLGQNTWLVLAILQVEILAWVKFLPQSLLEAEYPAEVRVPWLATLSMLTLWTLLAYITHKQTAETVPRVSATAATSIAAAAAATATAGVDVPSSKTADTDNATQSQTGAAAAAAGDASDNSSSSSSSSSGAGITRTLSFSDTVQQLRSRHSTKLRMLDVLLVLALLPLAYLARQWYT